LAGVNTVFKLDKETIRHIINVLRRGTVTWDGRHECLRRARKRVLERQTLKGKPVYKFHYQCVKCLKWFRDASSLEVDHIEEVGEFTGDWDLFIKKMYCGQDNLQAMCCNCHLKKTTANSSIKYRRRGEDE
jgi:hypothetical protein